MAQMATAGHPPPLMRTADGDSSPVSLDVGMPLGIDPGCGLRGDELQLEPSTLLAFNADGLTGSGGDVNPRVVSAGLEDRGNLESVGDRLIGGFTRTVTKHVHR
jgi:serine phosphatase RsbU (regulator of sigma subunit)